MSNTRKSFSSRTTVPQTNPLTGVVVELDGTEFRCEGRMSFLDTSDMARRVAELPTTDVEQLSKLDPQQVASVISSMASTLMMALGPVEYARFRQHCRDHETPDEVVIEVMQFLNSRVQESMEDDAGRPTQPPPPSSTGEPATEPRMSRIISLQTGDVTVLPEQPDRPQPQDHQPPAAGKQPANTTVKNLGGKSGGRRRTA